MTELATVKNMVEEGMLTIDKTLILMVNLI
jgi:hypothetical protein